jgi:hypothetical protein
MGDFGINKIIIYSIEFFEKSFTMLSPKKRRGYPK